MEKVKWGALGTADIARGCTIPGMQIAWMALRQQGMCKLLEN